MQNVKHRERSLDPKRCFLNQVHPCLGVAHQAPIVCTKCQIFMFTIILKQTNAFLIRLDSERVCKTCTEILFILTMQINLNSEFNYRISPRVTLKEATR